LPALIAQSYLQDLLRLASEASADVAGRLRGLRAGR